jgi:hypothetical protein
VERALEAAAIGARARELAAWWETHDPADAAAALVEGLAMKNGEPSTAEAPRTPLEPLRF